MGQHGHGEQRGASHQNEARSRQHSKGRDSPHACQQAEPHGDEADPAGQQRQPGPADCQPGTQQSRCQAPGQAPCRHGGLVEAVPGVPQHQGLFDEHRHTHHQQRAQQQVEGADQGDVLQDLRPFLPEEGPALRQIRSGGLPDAGSSVSWRMGDMDEQFHHRRSKEAGGGPRQDRCHAEGTVNQTPQQRSQQAGQGADLVDDGVTVHQPVRRAQQGHAGLHRRLVCPGDTIQQHHGRHQHRHQGQMPQGQRRQGHQGAGEEVQHHHDPLLMETVRHHAAQGRQHHHGHERRGGAQAEQAPGTGDVQQIQRQDESQHGVTQQGDDLSNHHQGEVPVKQLFPHLNSSSRSLLPAGPDPAATDRRPGPGAGADQFVSYAPPFHTFGWYVFM